MTVTDLLKHLTDKGVVLSVKEDELVVQGKRHALGDAALLERLRENKPALIELIRSGSYEPRPTVLQVPPNLIPEGCEAITPQMLPLVSLTQPEIDRIVAQVPGGAANVQDIYPLAPLQEGILFHHLRDQGSDVYVMPALLAFDTRALLDRFIAALQSVIARHDILRTAVCWEGLPEPVQVVWREAPLRLEEIELDGSAGEVGDQLHGCFEPSRHRIDVRQAPLTRAVAAHDAANDRWIALLMFHHLAIDHTTQEVLMHEIQAHLLGEQARLPKALPFRNFVAQARLGVPREQHEAFFREMLADVDEPTLPFGMADVNGDGSDVAEVDRPVDVALVKHMRERARGLGVSVASLVHLAWAQVLSRISGRDDVVFGTLLFGRMQGGEGSERVLGLFINTLPLRLKLGHEGVQGAVKSTHALLGR
ncbi:MAG TPA: condensation domain-containing protein, partial [Albitalea sp.]